MRILLLTPRLPFPPHRGDKLKIYNLIKRLARTHSIHLICFVQSKRELEHTSDLEPYCDRIDTVLLQPWQSFLQCIKSIFSTTPFQVSYFKSDKMQSLVEGLLKTGEYDIVHTHLIRMAQYVADSELPRKMLDLTDAISLYLERFLSEENNLLRRIFIKIELKRILKYSKILEQFHTCFVCSEPDRTELNRLVPSAHVKILPNGIDLNYFSLNGDTEYDPYCIVFTGNLTYFPNIDGVLFFMREIFPLIKKELPLAKFFIVGQSPPAKIKAVAREGVVVTGFVEDIRRFYLRSAVTVSPIRFGAGTLNKVLEPLALGVPVVATSVGIEGMDLVPGKDILIADDPASFSECVISILRNRKFRAKLAGQAKSTVRMKYDWDTIVGNLASYYQGLVQPAVSPTRTRVKEETG